MEFDYPPAQLELAILMHEGSVEEQMARDLMERLLRIGSPLGLYAEEFETETAMFLGNCGGHRNGAEDMPRSADYQQDQEPKETDSEQRVKEWLQANQIDDVDEQTQAEQKGDRLQPDEGTA